GAVADLVGVAGNPGRDGLPEVVVTRFGSLELLDGRTGAPLAAPYLLPTWDGSVCWSHPSKPGVGGAPAVGDVDGDGIPEVVVASGECLTALQLERNGDYLTWRMLWGARAVDESSSVTGVALFDFDANGWLDVVHADETVLHVNEGSHGAPKYEAPHCSGTVYEEPVVADVDGDGSANIVVARNLVGQRELGCDPSVKPGISVLRERKSRWANARAIWNQHAYIAPYVCDGMDAVCAELGPIWGAYGRVTMDPLPPWGFKAPGDKYPYNAARANTFGGYGPLGVADAIVTHVLPDTSECPKALKVKVRVANVGEAPLRPGTPVSLAWPHGSPIVTTSTTRPLRPGEAELVTLTIPPTMQGRLWKLKAVADSDDSTSECDEENNATEPIILACPLSRAR
ncbi:MAG: VCBS repeat-containing protein, partial [Myxococcaceae bacterium]|nr:VCBS repeat-containing protein [Myxococcaceae bacterium]